MATIDQYTILACLLFGLGCIGFLTRRNTLILFMCVELMLNAINLLLVSFSHQRAEMDGQVMVLFIFAVAAAEVAVGLAILIGLFKHIKSVDMNRYNLLKW